jgi:hypothetical protein
MEKQIDDYKRKPPFEPTHISKILAEVIRGIDKKRNGKEAQNGH